MENNMKKKYIYKTTNIHHFCCTLETNTGEGNGTPLLYSCLENPIDREAWWAAVHGVTKSRAWLSDFTFPFHFHALEKEMATHSSVLAWRIPGTGEAGGLLSMGSHRVGHDWSDLAAAETNTTCKSTIFQLKKGNRKKRDIEGIAKKWDDKMIGGWKWG